MTETAKERIYHEALDEINNLVIDVAMNFDETGIDYVDCGKLMDIINKALSAETNQQPVSTDELSVEKMQEDNAIMKDALIEISSSMEYTWRQGLQFERPTEDAQIAIDSLALLEGGEDE